jgi:hypothetical protein
MGRSGSGSILEFGEKVVEGFGEVGCAKTAWRSGGVGSWPILAIWSWALFRHSKPGQLRLGSGWSWRHDGFHEAAGLVDFEGPGDVVPGHFGDADRAVCARASASVRTDAASCGSMRTV